MEIKENEMMKNHTSFKIGGPADFFIRVNNIEELNKVLELSKQKKLPITLIGNGSNILVLDKGIRGIVLKPEFKEFNIKSLDNDNVKITIGAGVAMPFVAQKLLQESISGFEELSGIPGSLGGAIVMNAGAHGKEIKDIVKEIRTIDYNGNIRIFTNEEAEFEYRNSIFSKGEYIILEAVFLLQKGNQEEIKQKMLQFSEYRKTKQPISYPSAGSTFKRGEDFVTAKLIDEAGLKGYKIGGAEVSTLHAGFIINSGNATAKDVLELIEHVRKKVYDKFNKTIELEIKVLGEE